MNWEQLNQVLANFNSLRHGRNNLQRVAKQVVKEIDEEGEMGESGLTYEVYKISDDLYIKLTVGTDSYGENEYVQGVQFVQPKNTVVTSYESKSTNDFVAAASSVAKKSYDEILEILKNESTVSEFAHEGADGLDLGTITEIERVGGYDQGSTWYNVKHFVDHDVYIKVSGYYSSYSGTEFDGWDDACEHVRPALKTVTVYE